MVRFIQICQCGVEFNSVRLAFGGTDVLDKLLNVQLAVEYKPSSAMVSAVSCSSQAWLSHGIGSQHSAVQKT